MKNTQIVIIFIAIISVLLLLSCNSQQTKTNTERSDTVQKIITPKFDSILVTNHVSGAILIYDYYDNKFYSNNFEHCTKGFLPASTFKITNTLFGLESGIVDADTSIFYYHGEERALENWKQDLNLHDAFHYSCVPCYQELARNIGVKRMNEYLELLKYGHMLVDSSNIDTFWLEGKSQITQFEQIDFLKRLYFEELEISTTTLKTLKNIMVIEEDAFTKLSGKTGWVIRNGENTGWFVGFYETNDKVWFIATNIQPQKEFDMDLFAAIRKDISMTAINYILAETNEFIYFEF